MGYTDTAGDQRPHYSENRNGSASGTPGKEITEEEKDEFSVVENNRALQSLRMKLQSNIITHAEYDNMAQQISLTSSLFVVCWVLCGF